jgi:hypothetical protein
MHAHAIGVHRSSHLGLELLSGLLSEEVAIGHANSASRGCGLVVLLSIRHGETRGEYAGSLQRPHFIRVGCSRLDGGEGMRSSSHRVLIRLAYYSLSPCLNVNLSCLLRVIEGVKDI